MTLRYTPDEALSLIHGLVKNAGYLGCTVNRERKSAFLLIIPAARSYNAWDRGIQIECHTTYGVGCDSPDFVRRITLSVDQVLASGSRYARKVTRTFRSLDAGGFNTAGLVRAVADLAALLDESNEAQIKRRKADSESEDKRKEARKRLEAEGYKFDQYGSTSHLDIGHLGTIDIRPLNGGRVEVKLPTFQTVDDALCFLNEILELGPADIATVRGE